MSVDLYARFDQAMQAREPDDSRRYMPYDKSPLPDPLFWEWMAYSQMYDEFIRELANIINKLSEHVERLRAWAAVVPGLSDYEKLDACHIAIDDLATISLNLPYAIRSRFYFAGAHLSHQANKALQGEAWIDDLPLDNDIYQEAFDAALAPWKRKGKKLRLSLQEIGNVAYREATTDFRNAYNHRFSRRFVIGITDTVKRFPRESGGFGYGFGGAQPFELEEIAGLLVGQRDACYAAFDGFKKLVAAHVAAIAPINAEQLAEIKGPADRSTGSD